MFFVPAKYVCGASFRSPNRGVHRTWETILTQLLALFEKDPGLNFAPMID